MSYKKNLHFKGGLGYKYLLIVVFILTIVFCPNSQKVKGFEISNVIPNLNSIKDCVTGSSDSICMKLPEIKSSIANLIETRSISKDNLITILKTVAVLTANIFLALIETIADTIRLILLLIK